MMQEDEKAAMALRKRHREVFETEHDRHRGEVLQYYGDGTLSIFQSAVESVECATAIQQQLLKGPVVPLRIGLHLGDIIYDDHEIYGDGVNLASRVESMSITGSILISDKLRYSIKNHTSIQTRSLGFFDFKNVKDPVEVFAVTNPGLKVPDRSQLRGKGQERKKSVAVLPFVNMSSDPENEFFSDGIAEEILNALAKVTALRVTARTSSFMFKGKNLDVREIGKQLDAEHILEGSVRKAGNRVRVTAQLVSAIDGYHFFSETYDRTLEDIFAVQDEIASMITNRLREQLTSEEHQQSMVQRPTENMEAYEAYLRGIFFYNQWGGEGMQKAIEYFQKAIELEPDFPQPHARLADCYFMLAVGGALDWEEAHQKNAYHITRTRELGLESPEAYFSVGFFEMFLRWDWPAAAQAIYEGLEKFPSFPGFYHMLSDLYTVQGELDKAVIALEKGLALDPLSMQMILFLGIAHIVNRDHDKAEPYLDRVLEMAPGHRVAIEMKGWNALLQGHADKATALFETLEPEVGFRFHRATCLGCAAFAKGDNEQGESSLRQLKALAEDSVNFALDAVILCVWAGDHDTAFKYLEEAIHNKISDSMMMMPSPFFDSLRGDPRYAALAAMIGELPDMRGIEGMVFG